MDPKFFRKYSDLIVEAEKDTSAETPEKKEDETAPTPPKKKRLPPQARRFKSPFASPAKDMKF